MAKRENLKFFRGTGVLRYSTPCQMSFEHIVGRFWVDSGVHDDDALRFLVDRIGSDRVCAGSDAPFPLGEAIPGESVVQSQQLTQDERQRILWDNALAFLGNRARGRLQPHFSHA